jgi:hypothetical protein
VLHLDESPARLAASIAIGVFTDITPFFFLHARLAIAVAPVFRLNLVATTGAREHAGPLGRRRWNSLFVASPPPAAEARGERPAPQDPQL